MQANHRKRVSVVLGLLLMAMFGVSTTPASTADTEDTAEAELRPLTEEEVADLLERLETKFKEASSLRSDFTEEKHSSVFTDVVKASGVLLFERSHAVRFEITAPFRSVLIAKGKATAKYELLEDHWEKLDPAAASAMTAFTDQMIFWCEGRFHEQRDAYDIRAARTDCTTITLTPRDEEISEYIAAIELTLDEGESYFSCVTIREAGGDFTRMLFSEPMRNIEIREKAFDTTLPEPVLLEEAMPTEQELPSSIEEGNDAPGNGAP